MFRRFKLPRPPDDEPKVVRQTRHFRRRSPIYYQKKNDSRLSYNNSGYIARNCPQLKRLKDVVHLFDKIVDYAGIYFTEDDNLESVLSLEEEPMKDTLFSVKSYEESGDIYVVDIYLISITGENDQKSTNQFYMLNISGILSSGIADCFLDLFIRYVDPSYPSILQKI